MKMFCSFIVFPRIELGKYISFICVTDLKRNLFPQRRWYPYIKLHGTMSQKTVLIDITKSQMSKIFKCIKCALRCKTLFHSFTFV